jgi:hypothetical protein
MYTFMRVQRRASGSPASQIGSRADTTETSTCGTAGGIDRTAESKCGIGGMAAGIPTGPRHPAPGRPQDQQADPSAKGPPRDDTPTLSSRARQGSCFPPQCCFMRSHKQIPRRKGRLGMTLPPCHPERSEGSASSRPHHLPDGHGLHGYLSPRHGTSPALHRHAPCSARRCRPRAGAAHGLRRIPASHQSRDYAHFTQVTRGCA